MGGTERGVWVGHRGDCGWDREGSVGGTERGVGGTERGVWADREENVSGSMSGNQPTPSLPYIQHIPYSAQIHVFLL